MVEISVREDVIHLEVLGWSKVLALKSSLDIPVRCVKHALAGTAGLPRFRWTDLRAGGTGLPGVIAAGTFYMGSPQRRVFLDLRRWSKEIVVLELENYPYALVMVEVSDVQGSLQLIRNATEKAPEKHAD